MNPFARPRKLFGEPIQGFLTAFDVATRVQPINAIAASEHQKTNSRLAIVNPYRKRKSDHRKTEVYRRRLHGGLGDFDFDADRQRVRRIEHI